MISQNLYDVIQQPCREMSVRLFLLNSSFKIVGNLEGVTLSGSINVDANSDIRRSCSIELVVKDSSFMVGVDKKIWLDKLINIQIGIRHIKSQQMIWIPQGYYYINQPSLSYSATDKTLRFEALDPMIRFTERRNQLGICTKLTANTPISQALRTTVVSLGKWNNVIIEETNRNLPFDIEKSSTESVYSIIKSVSDLYMDCQVYFDLDGNFVYSRIPNRTNDPVLLDFYQMYKNLVLSVGYSYNFENVRNKCVVIGKQMDNGTQPTYTAIDDNSNSPYNINSSIGELKYTVQDDNIQTDTQVQERAKYELWKRTSLNNELTLEVVNIPWLDVNHKIFYRNDKLEINGDFLIQNLSIPLSINESMSIKAIKLI